MTVKPTISLTDQAYGFAKTLVNNGKFASLSAVMQYGILLIQREEAEHQAHLEAIRSDLDQRAAKPSMSTEDMNKRLAAWRARRKDIGPDELA